MDRKLVALRSRMADAATCLAWVRMAGPALSPLVRTVGVRFPRLLAALINGASDDITLDETRVVAFEAVILVISHIVDLGARGCTKRESVGLARGIHLDVLWLGATHPGNRVGQSVKVQFWWELARL